MGIIGKDKHLARLAALTSPRMWAVIDKAVHDAAEELASDAHLSITTGSVGGKFHVVSEPGEPPNSDSGDLAKGIKVSQVEPLHHEVASTEDYAGALEFGTSRMLARPYMQPAAARSRKTFARDVTDAISVEIRKGK